MGTPTFYALIARSQNDRVREQISETVGGYRDLERKGGGDYLPHPPPFILYCIYHIYSIEVWRGGGEVK